MSTFGLTNTENPQTIIDAVNYAISNLGQGGTGNVAGNALVVNSATGTISTGGKFYAWLYSYVWIAYADDALGNGFSANPTNKSWFGQLNTTTNIAGNVPDLNNPSAYTWTQVTGGFGTDKFLYFTTGGGGQVFYQAGFTPPTTSYAQAPAGLPRGFIDLTVIISGTGLSTYTATVYLRSPVVPAAPSGGLYNFSALELTPPVDWYAAIPPGTDPVYTSINTFASYTADTVPPSTFWTTPVLSIENGAPGQDGASTFEVSAYALNDTQPATPTGGSWNFGTAAGVAPTNGGDGVVWTLDPPSSSPTQLWVSYAVASVIGSSGTDSNLSWSTPAELSVAGATGPQGPRGFVPMAYVVTNSDPRAYTTAQFTQAFSASRGNITPPIGAGYPPIAGDTAQFIWSAGANTPNTVQTFNGSSWSGVVGQVIGGNLIVTGTVTASKLAANDIYAINIQSTNANLGNTNSFGYWLQANTGSARFGGNVSIGNNLTVGNLITAGQLNANTVTATQIASSAVGVAQLSANAVTAGAIANSAIILGKIAAGAVGAGTIATGAVVAGAIAANAVVAGTIAAGAVVAGTIAAGAVTAGTINADTMNGNIIVANTLGANRIVANSITSAQISTSYLYAGSIFGNQIVANTLSANSIIAGTITSTQIANNAITANAIQANAITSIKVAANAITAAQLAVGSVTQAAIQANTISGNIIIANTLSGNTILTNTLSGNTIIANTLLGNTIIANTISGDKIQANTITTTQISSNYVYAGNIISIGASIGNINSPGYWMEYQSGNARFGGNVWIGSNLVVGNLISNGQLNSNTVSANNIVPGTIPTTGVFQNLVGYFYNGPNNWTQNPAIVGGTVPVYTGFVASVAYTPAPSYFNIGAIFPSRIITIQVYYQNQNIGSSDSYNLRIYFNGKTLANTAPTTTNYSGGTGPSANFPTGSWSLLNVGAASVGGDGRILPNNSVLTYTFIDTSNTSRFFQGTNFYVVHMFSPYNTANYQLRVSEITMTVAESR